MPKISYFQFKNYQIFRNILIFNICENELKSKVFLQRLGTKVTDQETTFRDQETTFRDQETTFLLLKPLKD